MNASPPHAALNLEDLKITPFQLLVRGEGEMCSTLSPDKCTLLQETVNQIRHIKIGEECGGDELQKSEVSSSNVNPFIGSQLIAPFLLHALDGFCFVVNADGKIEYMSPNVESFLKYNSDSLVDSSIYNIIHVGDHSRFSSNLLPMSIGNGFNWSGGEGENPSFQCRFLVRPPSDAEETMEEKQTRVSLYEQMSVTTVLLPKAPVKQEEPQQEVLNRLICVARRVPPGERNGSGTTPEQFVTRLDARGKILSVDTANISSANLSFLASSDLVGRIIQEVCHPEDFQKLTQHLKETLQQGSNTSGIYRLRFSNEKIICVQTKSKRTSSYNPMASEHEVIVASHTIVRDSSSDQQQCMESVAAPSPGSSLVPSLNGGGPFSFPSLSPQDFNLNDLDFLPTSSWDLAAAPPAEAPGESPHRPGQQGGSSSRSTTPFGGAGFPFSPAPKQEPISNGELGGGGGGSPPLERIPTSAQQQKLRNLLTHGGPPEEADSSKQQGGESAPAPVENGFGSNGGEQGAAANENLILRELLNQEDEDMDTGNKDKRNNMLRKVSGGDLGGGPKRKSPDTPMEESMAKRPAPQPPTQPHAHLAGQNPMLASMLAQTPRTAPTVTTSLASAIVSQLPQERLPKNLEKKLVHTPYTGANPQGGAAPPPTYSFARGQHQQEVVTADARGHVTLGNPQHSFNQVNSNNNFLGHFGVGQNTANILIDGLAEAARDPSNVVSASDPLLSDILDQVWSMEQDMNLATDDLAFFKLLEELPDPSVQRPTPAPPVSQQVDAQEKLAIQSIQKQLMSCEPQQRQQPLYPQPFQQQPPPSYTRPPQQPQQQRPPHYGGFNDLTPPMRRQLLEQHKHKVFLQQQYNQKKQQQQLLLQQQQKQLNSQQLQNSMPGSPFGDSMSDLLNNAVAPNVTLQRSASMPEPQLSPRYSAPSPSSQLSPGQRGGFSPMGGGGYPPFPPQGQQQRHLTQQQQQQWTQQQRANLQQQNPMLNAQLSQQQFAAGTAQRFSSQQQQRQPMQQQLGGVHSPRNSPYPPDFHPSSPGMFQQQPTPPPQRMQRAVSIPNRVNSPRGLGGSSSFDPLLSPQPSPGSYSSPPVSNYGGYGGMDPNFPAYDQQQTYPATLMDRNRGNGGGAIRSEYVRQELRAKVGARTQQHQQIHQQQQQMVLPPGGSQSASQSISQADFDALGFSLDLGNDVQPPSPALYSQSLMNSVGGDPQRTGSPRFQLEERPAEQKKSLLQQLLSEPP